jgi:hypothetical protein
MLTHTDEPVHIFLCLRSGTRIRPISQDAAEGSADELVVAVPVTGHAGLTTEKPPDRIIFGPA